MAEQGPMPQSPLVQMHAEHYSDMPLQEFAQKLYEKHYSDMPFDQFAQKTGLDFAMGLENLGQTLKDPRKAAFDADVERQAQQAIAVTGNTGLAAGSEGLGRGMTGNFADRIVAAPLAVIDSWGHPEQFGREYDKNVAAMKREWELRQRAHPVAATTGEVAGGVGLGGRLAAGGATLMGPGQGLATRIGTGMVEGAGYGGVYGAGDAQKGQMLEGAGKGALGGAALGAAIPAAGAALKGGFDVADNALSPYLRPETFAANKVAQRIAADGKTVAGIQQKLDANPGLAVADVAGENTRGLVRTAANVPGEARQAITTRVNLGQLGQGQRVEDAISANIGHPQGWQSAADEIRLKQQEEASPLYQRAFRNRTPVDVSPVLNEIDTTIAPGISRMVRPNGGIPGNIAPDSVSGVLSRIRSQLMGPQGAMKSSIEQLHLLKMDLDGIIQSAQRGGNRTLVRKVSDVQRALVRRMDASSTPYRDARRIFAGEASQQNALDGGYDFIRGTGELAAADVARMTPAERQLFRLGIARGLRETINNAPDGADVVKRIFGSRAKRNALMLAFDNPQDRRSFEQAMVNEARRTRTRQAVTGNSTTARQQSDLEDAGIGSAVIGNAVTGNWGAAIKSLIGRAGARIGGVTPRVASNIADMTMTRDPAALNQLLQRVRQAGDRTQQIDNIYGRFLSATRPAVAGITSDNQ